MIRRCLSQYSVAALTVFTLLLTGCSTEDCTKQLVSIANEQGTRVAVLEVSGCGGATVGYVTDLKIVRTTNALFNASDYVWTAKGWVDAEIRWVTPMELEVRYPASLRNDAIVRKVPRSDDVHIIYIPVI